MPYSIHEHRRRFSAWAACRAASVKGCRFKVERGRAILKQSSISSLIDSPESLPVPAAIDEAHRKWRAQIIAIAKDQGLNFTHGVAAKLINVYLKAGLVCSGHDKDPRVSALHPPIDKVLLDGLIEKNVGNMANRWRYYANLRWSRFDATTYEEAIADFRSVLNGEPLWKIEEFWRGHQ